MHGKLEVLIKSPVSLNFLTHFHSFDVYFFIQQLFNIFTRKAFFTRCTAKSFKCTVVNRSVPSLHEGLLKILFTVPLIMKHLRFVRLEVVTLLEQQHLK